jgi:hypothetical protein
MGRRICKIDRKDRVMATAQHAEGLVHARQKRVNELGAYPNLPAHSFCRIEIAQSKLEMLGPRSACETLLLSMISVRTTVGHGSKAKEKCSDRNVRIR